jgi:hypothetical protein
MNQIQSAERRNGQLASVLRDARTWYYIHLLPRKGPEHQHQVLHGIIRAFKR